MKTKKKVLIVFGFCFMLMFAAGAAFVHRAPAKAEASPVVMEQGAAVRLEEPNGIRFKAAVSMEDYDALLAKDVNAQFGMLLIPADLLGGEELTLETRDVLNIPIEKWYSITETERTFTGVLVGEQLPDGGYESFSASEYLRKLTARAYVTANGVTQYAKNPQTASIAEVASKAIKQGGMTDELLFTVCDTAIGDGLAFAEAKTAVSIDGEPVQPTLVGTQDLAVIWDSDTDLFTVDDNGLVTPVAAGTGELTAKIGNKTATTQIVVLGAPQNVRYDEASGALLWDAVLGAEKYFVSVNGGPVTEVDGTSFVYEEKYGDFEAVVSAVCGDVSVAADAVSVRRLNEGEINDFEIPAFRNVFTEKNGTQLSVVKAADVGLTAPSGEYILQTSIAPADTYPTVVMPASYLERTDLKEIAESSVQNKVFSFSVYNALSRNIVIELWLNGQKAPSYNIAPQSWQEVSLRLDDYLAALKTSLLIEVTWGISATDENTLVYFDHFEVKDYLPPQLAEGEIVDFEFDEQRNSFSTQGTLSAEVVTAADVGLTAPSGTKILKAWTNVGTDYYAVILKEDYLSGTPMNTAAGQEKYLTFEIFCDEVRSFEVWIGSSKLGFKTAANSWKTVRLPMTAYAEFGAVYLTTNVTGGIKYYVDNFRLEDFVTVVPDAASVMDFELPTDMQYISTQGTLTAQIVNGGTEDIAPASGNNVLKVFDNQGAEWYAVKIDKDYLASTALNDAFSTGKKLSFYIYSTRALSFSVWFDKEYKFQVTDTNTWTEIQVPLENFTSGNEMAISVDVTGGVLYYLDYFKVVD